MGLILIRSCFQWFKDTKMKANHNKYDLAQDAATAVGLKYSTTILKVCKNIRKSAGGFTWRYA